MLLVFISAEHNAFDRAWKDPFRSYANAQILFKKKKKLTFITEPTDMTMYFLIAP